MNAKIRTPKIVIVILLLIGLFIALLIGKKIYEKSTINVVVTSEQQLARLLEDNAARYKTDLTFETTLEPKQINYDQIFHDIMAKNTYIGCELFAFSYTYTYGSAGTYKINLKLRNPAFHRVILTKIRVKQIADHLRDMDTYDQVKAVHDYLVLSNEYSYTMGSAFNALYVGKSACNGYAYSFYAIMEELGVPVTCEYGSSHAWNRVCIDDKWYNIDVTWDDIGGHNVSYDYFLKSDTDFIGHHHGGATATVSLPITGNSAIENYSLIPKYKLIMILSSIGAFLIFCLIIMLIQKLKRNKELREMYGNYK